ncbi:MAG: pgeF [Polaromonas sp.]|nr:pgeF [Polaromonas sp.]
MHPDWLIPDWPAPPQVRAIFTTRAGGTSPPPWDSMNLGDHVGDEPLRVGANRGLLEQALGVPPVFLRQVHGSDVITLTPATLQGEPADAAVTSQRGIGCTIMVADCLPVLLASADGQVVAAAHAGWRGLAGTARAGVAAGQQGVLEAVYESFSALAQANKGYGAIKNKAKFKVMAWLGPCIGPSAFEVGSEVKAAFEAAHQDAGKHFIRSGDKYLCDLAGLARLRLRALGIDQVFGNDSSANWCTVRDPARFYSHRRDTALPLASLPAGLDGSGGLHAVRGSGHLRTTGRMAACIWLA